MRRPRRCTACPVSCIHVSHVPAATIHAQNTLFWLYGRTRFEIIRAHLILRFGLVGRSASVQIEGFRLKGFKWILINLNLISL